jgi:uncharacterized glyoxalase superfamily protein PhnB
MGSIPSFLIAVTDQFYRPCPPVATGLRPFRLRPESGRIVRDPGGMNIPGGKSTVTPYVAAKGADRFLDFVEEVLTSEKAFRVRNPDGTVGHAEIRVGESVIMAFDSRPEWPETPSLLCVYVDDADEVVAHALKAGATLVTPVTTSGIIGDRGGRIKDPVGNIWWVQTHLEDVDEATMLERFGDPAELAVMREAQRSFDEEMRRR